MSVEDAALNVILGVDNTKLIKDAKVLVVGAGGIGCELLKSLVMAGFMNLEVIDLDTIDVSNLNRQFLFRKEHVGKSKSLVACETIQAFKTGIYVKSHHADVKGEMFNIDYFKGFDVVLNALDNVSARSHVNRMCLGANVPLVESGTAGYKGNIRTILKGRSECYDCNERVAPKSYPVCTIRNTPSLPIHCIVWAKYLFAQLFGEPDDTQEVSPNADDPEHVAESSAETETGAGDSVTDVSASTVKKKALREAMEDCGFDGKELFTRLYYNDVKDLLRMSALWKERTPPTPLDINALPVEDTATPAEATASSTGKTLQETQRVWSLVENASKFVHRVNKIKSRLNLSGSADGEKIILTWDKDEPDFLDFLVAASNLRACVFGIATTSLFDVKSMAGNIIPAIASTNAITAGYVVYEAVNIVTNNIEKCKNQKWTITKPNAKGRLIGVLDLKAPNPNCYECAEKPTASIEINMTTFTMADLTGLLKGALNMIQPDVQQGARVLISSDEDDGTCVNDDKTFNDMGLPSPLTVLEAEDFHQDYKLYLMMRHVVLPADVPYRITAGADSAPAPEKEVQPTKKRTFDEIDLANEPEGVKKMKIDDDDDIIAF